MSSPPSRQGSVPVGGATLHYRVEGSGPPVLVLGSATYYPRTFSDALRQSLTLAFADLRHFTDGLDDHRPNGPTMDSYAEDVDRLRAEVGFEQTVVLGHSHHGCVALEYAKRYPRRVSHVVMVGSPPTGVRPTMEAGEEYWSVHASDERKALLRSRQEALTPDRLATMTAAEAFVASYVADAPKYWHDPSYDAAPLWDGVHVDMDAVKAFRGIMADYQASWDPAHMTAPVLVVMGRHDYVVPHVLWEPALERLQNVTFLLFERSGHTPQLEEPERFDASFLQWLQASGEES